MLRYIVELGNLNGDLDDVERTIDRIAEEYDLTMSGKSTLKTIPGCIHWHFKNGKKKGVLEITYIPKDRTVWLEIHDNRRAEWNIQLQPLFADRIVKRLQEIG